MTKMDRLHPRGARVLVRVWREGEAENKTASGLVLPAKAKRLPQLGEVLEVGPKVIEAIGAVKPGDLIWFEEGAAYGMEADDDECLVDAARIRAVVETYSPYANYREEVSQVALEQIG